LGRLNSWLIVRSFVADTSGMLAPGVSSLAHTSSQDTWHTDQQAFNEDQLQSLSTMLVGTSYCESSEYSLYLADTDTIDRRIDVVSLTVVTCLVRNK